MEDKKRWRTSMDEQKWYTSFLTLLMHEMHLQLFKPIHVDLGREVRKLVQLGFLCPPVEAILPVVG
jgi:hypothetical protein